MKQFLTVFFALGIVLCCIVAWAYDYVQTQDDCVSRGHTPGWCRNVRHIDTGR